MNETGTKGGHDDVITLLQQMLVLPQCKWNGCCRGVSEMLDIDHHLLHGNIQTLGRKPDGNNWSVGITDPSNPAGYLGILSVGEAAIVTTGSYQNFMPANPKYHHIMNTSSGYPTTNGLLSVTIICDDGTYADCLSTAMFAVGQSRAINYWRQYGGFEMILINDSGNVICTSGLLEEFDLKNDFYTLSYVE